jgi:hypothetical protein
MTWFMRPIFYCAFVTLLYHLRNKATARSIDRRSERSQPARSPDPRTPGIAALAPRRCPPRRAGSPPSAP